MQLRRTQSQQYNSTKGRFIAWGLICAVAAIAAIKYGAKSQQSPIVTDAAYRQALADVQKAGFTTALPVHMPPDGRNAAVIYENLTAYLKQNPLTQDDLYDMRSFVTAPNPAQIACIRSLLKRRSTTLRLTHLAVKRPECVFQRKRGSKELGSIEYGQIDAIREAARYLSMESFLMATDGQGVVSAQNLASGFRIAQHIGSGQSILGFLEQTGCDRTTFLGFQRIMIASHGDGRVAKVIRQAIQDNWHQPQLALKLRQETASQIAFIEQSRRVGPGPSARMMNGQMVTSTRKVPEDERQRWNSLMNANGINLLTWMPQIVAAADWPYPEAHAKEDAIAAAMDRDEPKIALSLPKVFDGEQIPQMTDHAIAHNFLVSFEDGLKTRTSDIALGTVTKTAAALFEYRAAHGAFPATLASMGSPAPIDPFNLKPLGYRREGKGFVLYSVGPTLKFDGGKPGQELSGDEASFRYEP